MCIQPGSDDIPEEDPITSDEKVRTPTEAFDDVTNAINDYVRIVNEARGEEGAVNYLDSWILVCSLSSIEDSSGMYFMNAYPEGLRTHNRIGLLDQGVMIVREMQRG